MPAISPVEDPAFARIKAGMRAAWTAGDFGVIAHAVEQDAEAFAQRLAIPAGARVLDVATGTGNVALPLARAGAIVTGVDIAPNLLEQARQRATAANLSVQFDEGDAEALPYPDNSFDAVVTMFGAMFAPRPERVAAEFARVLRPGGTLAMANWTPGGFAGQMFAVGAKHAPPPAGPDGVALPAPVLWGDPMMVYQRLDGLFCSIRTQRIALTFDMPMSPTDTVEHFRRYFGPTQLAFQRLDAAAQQAFATDLTHLWTSANTSNDPEHRTLVPNEYLQVTAVRAAP